MRGRPNDPISLLKSIFAAASNSGYSLLNKYVLHYLQSTMKPTIRYLVRFHTSNFVAAVKLIKMLRRVVPTLRHTTNNNVVRGFSTSNNNVDLPRITERRLTEVGRGGRASDAGIKVAVFGATGFLGRYVCSGLGK